MAKNDDTDMLMSETSRLGGQTQGTEDNPGNFANDRDKASNPGKAGAANQPRQAKIEGGKNSHLSG